MAEVTIYTRPWCGYCVRAKRLLDSKGVAYDEIDVQASPEAEREMIERAGGGQTVPQIFIGGRHVGGSDELRMLEARGELDRWLTRNGKEE